MATAQLNVGWLVMATVNWSYAVAVNGCVVSASSAVVRADRDAGQRLRHGQVYAAGCRRSGLRVGDRRHKRVAPRGRERGRGILRGVRAVGAERHAGRGAGGPSVRQVRFARGS